MTETPILDADYAAIEARIVCWLAGQEDALEEYRQGVDRYKRMAASVYRIPEHQVEKFPQRFVGKSLVLGAGFGLGSAKFRVTCKKMGYDLPAGLEDTAIKAWRSKHPKVVKFWAILDNAAKRAVLRKGEVCPAGQHISFKCRDLEGMSFLLMRLPSGRKLAYPQPKIVPGKFEGSTEVSFLQNLKGVVWGHRGIWGGVWTENATQAVAADIMLHGVQKAEDAGYETMSLIHDQCLSYKKPGQTIEELVRHLTDLPSWAVGLPLAAEGAEAPFYSKG